MPAKPAMTPESDQRAPDQPVGAYACEAGRFGVAAGGEHVAAGRRVLEDEPDEDGHEHEEVASTSGRPKTIVRAEVLVTSA